MSILKLSKKDIVTRDSEDDKIKLKKSDIHYDTTPIGNWEADAKKSFDTLKKYQEKLDRQEYFSWGDLKAYESAMKSYIDNSNRLRNLGKSLGQSYTEEEETQWNDSVSSLQSGYKQLSDYFSTYKDEKAYKDAVEATKQLETMKAEDVAAGMAEVNSILNGDEMASLKEQKAVLEKGIKLSHRDNGVYLRKHGYDKTSAEEKLSEIEEQISKIEEPVLERKDYLTQSKYVQNYFYLTENDLSLEELESHLNDEDRIAYTDPATGKNITWQKLVDDKKYDEWFNAFYNEMSAMPDWAEKSKYTLLNEEINKLNKDIQFYNRGDKSRFASSEEYNEAKKQVADLRKQMTDLYGEYIAVTNDKEKELLNYLANTKSTDYANDQLMAWEYVFKERLHNLSIENARKFAEQLPVLSDVTAVLASLVTPFEYLGNVITGNTDDRITSADFASTIKSTRMEQIDWEIGNWDVFDFLYGTGTSMAESLLATALYGPYGGISLGLNAAAQETNSALDRGLTSKEAFWSGLAAGTFECFFETVSIGQFNKLKTSFKSGGKEIAKNIARSMLVNATEETLTEIANITYDTFVNTDFSNYETMVRTYVMQGMSVEKAQAQAKSDLKWQVVEAMGSGALMGFGFGTVGSVSAHRNARAVESSYDDGDINTIISEGLAVPGSEAYKLAQQAQEKINQGKSLSAQEILDLQNATTKAFTEADLSKMIQAAEVRLTELGEGESAGMLAEIVAKQAAGQKLTVSEKSLLKNSKYGQRVANEMSPENIASGNYASAWAEDIGTDLVNRDAYNMGLYDLAQEMVEESAPTESAPTQNVTPQFIPYSNEYIENLAKEYEAMGIPTEQAKSLAVSQVARPSETNSSPTTENAVETEFEVSKDGETFDTKSGKAINIKKIDSISEGGVANLKLDNGMIIKASDVSFGTEAEAIIVEQIGKIKLGKKGISTSAANALYQRAIIELKNNPNMTANEAMKLVQGLKESFYYGAYNFGSEKLTTTDKAGRSIFYAGELNESQRNWAYKLGKQERANETNAKQKALDDQKAKPKTNKNSKGKIIFEDGINVDESALTKTQKANLEGIKLLSEVSSIEFHIFKSTKVGNTFKYTMPNGTVVSANGWYVSGTNEIWVDLNAGNAGQGTMIRTAAHEISHYIKQWSPKKWQAMADLLMESFAKNGVDTESMLSRQIDKIKRRYTKKNMPSPAKLLDMAHEEFVSDALTDMLTDGSVVNFMAEVKAQDKSLWQKIRDAIKNLLNKWGLIVEDYKGRSLDAAEAQALSQLEDTFVQLQQMYQEAFVDANEAVEAAEKGMFVDEISESFDMRDSEGNELSEGQQKYFAESKFVDEEGNLLRLYHGTQNGGFTIFNPKYSDDGITLFLTPSRELANTYTTSDENIVLPQGKKAAKKGNGQIGIYEVYANAKNPYILEGNGANWNALPFKEKVKGKTSLHTENTFDYQNNILTTKVTIDGKAHEKVFDFNHLVEPTNAFFETDSGKRFNKEVQFKYKLFDNAKAELREYYRTFADEELTNHLVSNVRPAMHLQDGITRTYNGVIDNKTGETSQINTRFVSKWAKDNGYDGVWFKNIRDTGGKSGFQGENAVSDVLVVYDSNQIKSVDNLNPTKNKDIRFSERGESDVVDTIGTRNLADYAEAKNTNGEALFQYRAMKADEAEYRDMLKKWGKMNDRQIENLFTTIDRAMDIIKDNLEVLDYAWETDINDRAFSPVKPNSDSLYQVSLDFSTLCRKRILQQTIQVHLQEALNQPLTREEGIAIRDALMALQEEGRQIEVACALCYVESARMKSPEQIKKFLNNREAVIKDFFAGKSGGSMKAKIKQAEIDVRENLYNENPNGIKGKDGTMLDPRTASLKAMPKKYADAIRNAKKAAKESYKPTAEEQQLIEVANGMTISDFTSPEGLENLAKNYPQLFDAYTSYVRNATKSKGIEGDTWWRAGDSQKIGDVLIANMNKENGLRSQSWSDFQVIHILDYIAATIELSTRNAKEQAYSKVPDYVELMGQTGVMINMSLIPTRDFNGKLDYDSVEGMAYERALELREKYPATAGTICIGVDNKQIQMLLADSTIDYVIPYHKSGMAASVRKLMHIPTWSQYEEYQSEKNLSREAAVAQAKKYGVKLLSENDPNYHKHTAFSEWFDLEVAKQIANMENANPTDKAMQKKYGVMYGGYMAMQDAANNYLKLCAERGISPKFSHENADFTGEDNYWKLLIDRKMVNNATGEIIEQQAIKPIFDEGEVLRILNDELERYPSVKADQDYATRKVTEKFLSGEIKSGMSAEAIAKVMKTPVDNIAKTNILASVEGETMMSERDAVVDSETAQTEYMYSERAIAPITETEYKDLEKNFGTTGNFKVAGYLLTNGKLLDFSGKHWGDTTSRTRQVDHREAEEVLNRGNNGINAMVDMIGNGNIRLMPEIGGINLAVYPNEKQRRVLSVYINYMLNTEGQIVIDYDSVGGDTVYSKTYGKTATSRQILNDIRNYFNGARQSELMQFHTMYSERDNSTSNRSILANALEGAAQNDVEKNKLAQYKDKIAKIEAEEKRLGEIQKQLFTKGAVDSAQRKDLQFEAKQIANRINTYDRQLLNLESTTALKNVLNREKAKAMKRQKQKDADRLKQYKEKVAKTTKELMTRNQESRAKSVEGRHKTALRNQIKRTVNQLNNLLTHGTKERNIKEGLKDTVASALGAAELMFNSNITNDDIVRNGVEVKTEAESKLLNEYADLLAKKDEYIGKIDALGNVKGTEKTIDGFYDMIDRIDKRIAKLNSNLSDVFERERTRLNEAQVSTALSGLAEAYKSIQKSELDYIKNSYDEYVAKRIDSLKESVGGTLIRDMNLGQLQEVYDMYKMVKHTIATANEAFAQNLKMTRQELGDKTYNEIKNNNKARDRIKHLAIEKFGWKNLKPMQAMKTIGSETLQTLWNNVLYGQEIFAQDFYEAVEFAKETKKKHGYDNWDLTETYSFESKSGKEMKINLEQMMSIYAYSKRAQADEHIELGGVLLNESVIKEKNKLGKTVEVKVNDANAYRFDKMQVAEIISKLEDVAPGAKAFVDEMQQYLSDMGVKGNEVSMALYGVEIFKDNNYFPLKSSKEFMEAANAKLKGDVKIKNKGMAKPTVPHARNPIVLENFLDVWGNHVNEMSMYHGLVLPLEDFSRTLSYGFKADEEMNTDAESVRTALHNAFGDSADNYLNELMKAINGGVLHDSSAEIADKMISKFKKAKVMASLSVIVQQPTAIIRAMGIIEPKYFVHQDFHHKQTWEELKKYCPTAIIKEVGSFDTGMGKTIVDMIKEDESLVDKIGDKLGRAPAYMDEMGWNMIWRALKKKVAAEQNLSGEELLKECGKQMTLILNETQVYDSVMARNELMRSKSTFTKMATSFMAEPTTVLNMVWGAALDFRRGDKSAAGKAVSAVASSIVVNALVSALIYAMRDDDEDKTFLEKYTSAATTEIFEGFNPITYIPIAKDVYSILQGYDVERTDLALYSDVADAVDKFYNVLDPEAYEDMEQGEIASYIWGNAKPLLTSICDMFGLPVGNILRDAEAIIVNDSLDMSKTNSTGTGYAFKEGAMSSLPKFVQKLIGKDTKSDQLYDAIVSNDTEYLKRLKDTYKDEKAYKTAVRKALGANENLYDSIVNGDTDSIKRWKSAYPEKKDYESLVKKALRENDPRIREAAELRRNGEGAKCFEIVDEIANEKHFSRTLVISAVNAELDKIKKEEKENKQ